MPNQRYREVPGDFEMAQCDVSLSYPTCKERLCRLGYTTATWCPTCDKDSPRKRSKSETLVEPCRRKVRDTKSLSKKYDWNKDQECENMELEYDLKDTVSDVMRWDRVRSNLCELPTTYISNNCLKVSNQDFLDINIEKTFKSNESNPNFGNIMVERQDKFSKLLPKIDETARNINGIAAKMKQIDGKKLKPVISVEPHYQSQKSKNGSFDLPLDEIRNWRSSSIPLNNKLVELNFREVNDQSSIYYDTCTFFDKKVEVSNLREQYSKEVEILKEKLKLLKQNTSDKQTKYISPIVKYNLKTRAETIEPFPLPNSPCSIAKSSHTLKKWENHIITKICNEDIIEKPKDVPPSKEIEVREQSPSPKNSLTSISKVSLKTKGKLTNVKFTKQKLKSVASESDFSDSDCSDSEASLKDIQESESLDEISITSSSRELTVIPPTGSGDSLHWPVRPSLFPHIPPYLIFVDHDNPTPQKYPWGARYLKWKLSTITPILVRKTLVASGFRLVRKSNEWLGTWGRHLKSQMFQTLKENQKLNHFAGTFQLGRKDRLWRNFQRLIVKFGCREFGFTPRTYVLPQDLKILKQHWHGKLGTGDEKYIIKPPASARGTGIKVINRWCQLPKRTALVVQEYIANPYLINNSKFDLRLYVLVTSFNPLRIYLYPNGLARFASVPYSDDPKDLRDKFMHLTNYSINKLSTMYTANEDANSFKGHKWTLTKLWEYMSKRGINTKAVWNDLEQLVIKTMITAEPSISALCRDNMISRYNCYELFGIDVLIDEHLKCWLLEVNISPSLHSQSPLDEHVKGPLVKTLFNLAQFHLPPKIKRTATVEVPPCYDARIYTTNLTKKEINKHNYFSQLNSRNHYLEEILHDLTGDDVRHLTQAEDELTVIGDFQRIFPTAQSYKYLIYMEARYYNRLFDAWEYKYEKDRDTGIKILQSLCEQKIHLKIAPPPVINKSLPSLTPVASSTTVTANPVPSTDLTIQDLNLNTLMLPTAAEKEKTRNDQEERLSYANYMLPASLQPTTSLLSSSSHVPV